jgi:hypothetical protein
MIPNVMVDMTPLLEPFGAGCVGFVTVVFVALFCAMVARHPHKSIHLRSALPRRTRRAAATA